ncbi:hypothetical protein VTH06DRAFT_2836 [Thermothelomyces fergusii]
MAILPDWLLRLGRVEPADNPILAVEKLSSRTRPFQDADKEILVGAILTMSSSLHLALDMLQEILPQERSQERLGEELFTAGSSRSLHHAARQHTRADYSPREGHRRRRAPPPLIPPSSRQSGHGGRAPVKESENLGPTKPSRPQTSRSETERFPPFEDDGTVGRLDVAETDICRRPAEHLASALQAEMRVQAAINVAIESLEFAEGQLKMVREVNRLHGGIEQRQLDLCCV